MPSTLLAAKITLECFFIFLFINLILFICVVINFILFIHFVLHSVRRINFVRFNHFHHFVPCIHSCDFTTTKHPGWQPAPLARSKRRCIRYLHALRHDVRVSAE